MEGILPGKRTIESAFQDLMDWWCGCGRPNERGFHFKSYCQDDEVICTWSPEPYHGRPGQLLGGLIAYCILVSIKGKRRSGG
jgi:hypothetical protein